MKERYSHELTWLEKLLGIWRVNKDSIDAHWGYFAPRFGFEFKLNRGGYFSQKYSLDFCFIWGKVNFKLPFKTKLPKNCEYPSYGFYTFANTLILNWDTRYKSFDLPFVSWVFEWHRVMGKSGKWVNGNNNWDNQNIDRHTYDYTYVLNCGDVQHRKATCFIEERQWHRKWLPWIKMRRREIDISFDGEVGEGADSWKGGTLGCNYGMLPNETIEECLRRMEKERKFN